MAYNAEKKKSYTVVCQKKFFHQRVGEKNFTQTKLPISPVKSQMVGPSLESTLANQLQNL